MDESDGLENRFRTPVNESLGLKEALSFEGAFLVSEAPPSGRHRGWVPVTVGVFNEGRESPNLGQSGLIHEHRKMVISGITGCDG